MDVVRSNFEVTLPQIEEALEKSEFIGRDTRYLYSSVERYQQFEGKNQLSQRSANLQFDH